MTAVDGLQCNLSISLHSWTLLQYFRLLLHYTSTPLLWYCIFKLLYLQNYLITSVTSYFECCISVFAHMSPSLLLLVKFCHFFPFLCHICCLLKFQIFFSRLFWHHHFDDFFPNSLSPQMHFLNHHCTGRSIFIHLYFYIPYIVPSFLKVNTVPAFLHVFFNIIIFNGFIYILHIF